MAARTLELPTMRLDRRRLNPWHIAVFIVVTVLVVVPVSVLILGSFSDAKMPMDFTWSTLTFANYPEVWLDPGTYDILYNTVVYVGGATFVGVSVAAILAWLVERTTIPGKIWIYAGVPPALEEAASVSGARPWRILWRVFMPLLMPSLVGIWIYVVLLSVRLAGAPLILYEGRRTEVIAVPIWYLWDDDEWEAVAAMGVMLMLGLFSLVLLLRALGFGRSLAQAR